MATRSSRSARLWTPDCFLIRPTPGMRTAIGRDAPGRVMASSLGARPCAVVWRSADMRRPTARARRPASAPPRESRGTCPAESARGRYERRSTPGRARAAYRAPSRSPSGFRLPGSPAWLPIWKLVSGVSRGPLLVALERLQPAEHEADRVALRPGPADENVRAAPEPVDLPFRDLQPHGELLRREHGVVGGRRGEERGRAAGQGTRGHAPPRSR